jgi:hypothetical protein
MTTVEGLDLRTVVSKNLHGNRSVLRKTKDFLWLVGTLAQAVALYWEFLPGGP